LAGPRRPQVVPQRTWSFEEAVRAGWAQYVGGGIESQGRRNTILRIWAGLAGSTHSVASLDRFVEDYGGMARAAEAAGMAASTLQHLRREFAALPAAAAGPHYAPELSAGDYLRGERSSYTVETQLGQGGTARVYRVRHVETQEPFAAKLLSTDRFEVTAAVRERFLREASIASSLSHPNVVRTIEVLIHRTELVAIMEQLDGRNAAQVVRASRPSLTRALGWIDGLLAGTAYLHEKEIVHRDISPKNLFLRSDDVTAIGDYGIARRTTDATITAEEHRRMMGSLIYISPQQRRDPHAATFHDDVYSIGQVAFFILTGDEPHGTTAPAREIAPEVPDELSALVDRWRARLARDRPRDAIEAHAAFRESRARLGSS
jgi:hypothetical protein